LFLGGRSGVGKTSIGYEIHAQLPAARIQHCLIEGDNLDMAWPTPHEHGLALAEQHLAVAGSRGTPRAIGPRPAPVISFGAYYHGINITSC
jgi:hypothetical protein